MDLLDGLTEAQASAVTTAGSPLVILAGAGSGKTRVLTRRIAHRIAAGTADPGHVLALTFTRKAAGELRSRLGQLGIRDSVAAGTFHGIAYTQLRRHWSDNGQTAPVLLDRKVPLLARLLGARGGRDAAVQPMDLAAEIEWAKARLVSPAAYEAAAITAGRTPPVPVAAMAGIYERYEAEKRRRGLVDFDDLLLKCLGLLHDDPAFAAAQRWRFRHLFVDEFQDVNPAQAGLLAAWRGDRDDLCVVGDPNQAIYAWNGADPGELAALARQPSATVVRLEDNFRSSPQVLAVAASVLAGAGGLRAHRPDGPLPTVQAYATDRDEACGVARSLRRHHRPGTPWSRLAVLARTNAQLVLLEVALREVGIPFRVRGGGAFLAQPEVRDALDRLRRAGGSLGTRLVDLAIEARAVDDDADSVEGPATARRAVLAELVRLGHEHLTLDPGASAEGFLSWLTTALGGESGSTGADAVELATFHAAKGLEWPVVFLVGLERGLVPIGRAKAGDTVDEERRLLYVAVTRAEEELHVSWARERTFATRTMPRQPSPWLDDIQAARAALSGGGDATDLRSRVADERRKLRAIDGRASSKVTVGADADPEVLAALKTWRSGAARAAGVPAFVIFHDTTLAAVAEARPASRSSLLALPGLGPVKAERYGDELLRVVAEATSGAA